MKLTAFYQKAPGLLLGAVLLVALMLLLVNSGNRRGGLEAASTEDATERLAYLSTVQAHFRGHPAWQEDGLIARHARKMHGGYSTTGPLHRTDLIFDVQHPQIRHQVMSRLIHIFTDMDVLNAPVVSVISEEDGRALLAGPEGWLLIETCWLLDDPRVMDDLKVLRVEMTTCLQPRAAPSEQQSRHRLTWVSSAPSLQ